MISRISRKTSPPSAAVGRGRQQRPSGPLPADRFICRLPAPPSARPSVHFSALDQRRRRGTAEQQIEKYRVAADGWCKAEAQAQRAVTRAISSCWQPRATTPGARAIMDALRRPCSHPGGRGPRSRPARSLHVPARRAATIQITQSGGQPRVMCSRSAAVHVHWRAENTITPPASSCPAR